MCYVQAALQVFGTLLGSLLATCLAITITSWLEQLSWVQRLRRAPCPPAWLVASVTIGLVFAVMIFALGRQICEQEKLWSWLK